MITGKFPIELDGKGYTLRFDWEALAEVEQAHGDQPNLFNPDVVASVAAFGLRRHHPEMTTKEMKAHIKATAPPLIPFAREVQKALQYAYFGAEDIPEAKKKSGLNTGGWWQRLKNGASAAWTRSNSSA